VSGAYVSRCAIISVNASAANASVPRIRASKARRVKTVRYVADAKIFIFREEFC